MTPRALARTLLAYLVVLIALCAVVRRAVSLKEVDGAVIQSAWRGAVLAARQESGEFLELPDLRIVKDKIVGEGPLVTSNELAFAMSIVPGRDGVEASMNDLRAYVTPDDLLSHQGYDKGITIPALSLSLGADVQLIEALLAERLGTTVPDLRERARFRRIRTERVGGVAPRPFAQTKPEDVTPDLLRGAALEAARYLTRGVGPDGRFRYIVDAPTNRTLPGYDWPRHAAATFFLAQAWELGSDPMIRDAALRTAVYLRDKATVDCGAMKCVGSDAVVDVGSSALALIAMSEIARSGIDPSFRGPVEELAKFLRAQQRPDGEFMHQFDRRTGKPIDVQFIYYSGEVTVALGRAHALTGDAADLAAARRGLAHLVGPAWSFFGSRYYFGEEHWTCQAVGDLWERAPDTKALDFCARWRAYDARMMYAPGETLFDADGAFGAGPVLSPRLTPTASRSEAGVATLEAMIKAGWEPAAQKALDSQLRRSFALLMRQQLRPGLVHLFADPAAVEGAMPGSPVDWQLRVDYTQHAGTAMIRAASLWSK